jgi:hypothetical protein
MLPCAGFSLNRALQLGLPQHLPVIEEVSEYASKVRPPLTNRHAKHVLHFTIAPALC